tara:strand:+ start:872 stop:1327 length:456 start_codon:yes stop_codon:yes gene_type:complete
MELKSLEDTKKFSKGISNLINPGDIIFLYGDIGVGKTTFVRFLINHIENKVGVAESDILSPTFNILYDYKVGDIQILHYDLYRLKNHKDILQLGMFENSEDQIKIIEWPELIKTKPENRIDIFFKYSKLMKTRNVKIIGQGKWKDQKFNEI